MDHFRVSAEVLPRSVGAYPRVVSGLYEEWTRDGSRERERGGVRPTEDKLVHTHTQGTFDMLYYDDQFRKMPLT